MANELSLNYTPFTKQIEAHGIIEPIAGYFGGWGSGKTTWLIAEAFRNSCYMPGLPGIVASPTFPIQRKTLYPTIVSIFPGASRWPRGSDSARRCLGPLVREWVAQDKVLVLDIGDPSSPIKRGGTDWYFGSLDDPGSIEGGTYAWGAMDEGRLASHDAWRVFNSRIRDPHAQVHRRSVAGVPAMGWMHEEFNRGIPGRRFVRASSQDNPNLPEDYADSLNLTGRLALAYIHGHFVVLEGTVFWTYQPELGASLLPVVPDPSRTSYGAIDFGRRRPYFALIQEVEHEGRIVDVVVDEVPGMDLLEEQHANQVADLLVGLGITMVECFCDPAGDTRNAQTGLSSVHVYDKVFKSRGVLAGTGLSYSLSPIERHIPNRVEAARARFEDMNGERHMFMAERLTEPERIHRYPPGVAGLHDALLGYAYPKNRPGNDMPKKDGTFDHACDALCYFVINRYGVVEQPDLKAMNALSPGESTVRYGGGGFSMEDF